MKYQSAEVFISMPVFNTVIHVYRNCLHSCISCLDFAQVHMQIYQAATFLDAIVDDSFLPFMFLSVIERH